MSKKKKGKIESIPTNVLEDLARQLAETYRDHKFKIRTSFVVEVELTCSCSATDQDFFVEVPVNQPLVDEELNNMNQFIEKHPLIAGAIKEVKVKAKAFRQALKIVCDEYDVSKQEVFDHIENLAYEIS